MTATDSTTPDVVARRQRYRRLMIGFVAGGAALGILLREGLGYPLVGEAVYWLGILGFLAVWWASPLTLFDERDEALERHASQRTLLQAGVVLVLGASATRVLAYTGTAETPPELQGFLWGYVALFVLFGLNYVWLRYER